MEPPSVSDSGSTPAPPGTPNSSGVAVNHDYVPESNPSSASTLERDLGRAINSFPTYRAAQIQRETAPSFTGALGEGAERNASAGSCGKRDQYVNKGNHSGVSRLGIR